MAQKTRAIVLLIGVSLLLTTSHADQPKSAVKPGLIREGLASWYGPKVHGRPTASGEMFNQHRLTAAHRTLPLGSTVRVTNLENGKQVQVFINDRGPSKKSRLIDLSYAAARALGILKKGQARVRIRVLALPSR